MKLAHQQLTQALKKPLAPCYLITGDEWLIVDEALQQLRQACLAQGYSERCTISPDPNTDWGKKLFTQTQSLSLFSSKRFIELDLQQNKLSQANSAILQEYAANPASDVILIIRTTKLDPKSAKARWFQALEKNLVIITIWSLTTPEQLTNWLKVQAKKLDLTLTPPDIALIALQSEGNLLAAAQELEKLKLLSLTQSTLATEHDSPIDAAHFTIFDLVDSFLLNDRIRCQRILANLAAEETEPTLILWALTRELRQVALIMHELTRNITLITLFNKYRVWDKRQSMMRTFIKHYKSAEVWQMLQQAAQIDLIIKGMKRGNVWHEFERLLFCPEMI
jgi:DNA polymerase-3 subunit delta